MADVIFFLHVQQNARTFLKNHACIRSVVRSVVRDGSARRECATDRVVRWTFVARASGGRRDGSSRVDSVI